MTGTQILNNELARRRRYRAGGSRRQLGAARVIDQANNICDFGGLEIACNLIREFDDLPDSHPWSAGTQQEHFEYALPYGSPNVNIYQVQADNSLKYINPTGNQPVPEAPKLNFAATPTTYDNPVFNGMPVISESAPPTGSNSFGQGTTYRSDIGTPATKTQNLTNPGGSAQAGSGGQAAANPAQGTDGGTENDAGAAGGGSFNWDDLFGSGDGKFFDALKAVPTWAWLAAGGLAVAAATSRR